MNNVFIQDNIIFTLDELFFSYAVISKENRLPKFFFCSKAL